MSMRNTLQHVLELGKQTGFSTVEVFGEKTEEQSYDIFVEHKVQAHEVSAHRVTTRAFWDAGDPVGFRLSNPSPAGIRNAFSSVYSMHLPGPHKNHARLLPKAVKPVDVHIFDNTARVEDPKRVDELMDQIHETMISPPFKDLKLTQVHFSRVIRRVYLANTLGLNAKYIKSQFLLKLGVALGGSLIEISDGKAFFKELNPFKLISRAYNMLHTLSEESRVVESHPKQVPLVLSPEASAFILKEFADYFKRKPDKTLKVLDFPAILNIVDDPVKDGRVGSVPFDDEGVQGGEKYLIRKGAFSRTISDIETAFFEGEKSTGNGFRGDKHLFPRVRFSNLYIKPTVLSLKNLMGVAGKGILVSLLKLRYVERDGYVFSAYGYRFDGDNLLEPVHFHFRTTFLSYFLNILKISKEIKFFHSAYNIGSPYILLEARRNAAGLLVI